MFNSKKPLPGKNHPDDERQLAEAKESIGDYRIKDSDDYKPPPRERETTVKKYKQVLDARLKQFNLRHAYIAKVWSIRDLKYETRDKLLEKKQQLQTVQQDLPHQLWKTCPPIPDIQEDEFPEKKFNVEVVMEYETENENVDEKKLRAMQFVEPPDAEQLGREILPLRQRYPTMDSKGKFVSSYPDDVVQKVVEQNLQSLIDSPEDADTPYEMCLRVRRLNRSLFLQFQIISEMEQMINDFNNTIEETKMERLPLLARGNFIDLHILTLNQELNILKQFESQEDALTDKVNESLKKVHAKEDEIDTLKNKQEAIEAEIENLHQEEIKIQDKFRHAAENNKFYDFLKKVFKKKYKPPKVHVDGESSSESSSSSSSEESDEDDAGSIDSKDFGFIKQDLNVCPKGCEVAIYNLTVELRSMRHEVEQAVRDQKAELEVIKKNIDMANRQTSSLQNHFKASQRDLENYQREKQKMMNQVKCVTILNASQICDLNLDNFNIDDYLVFSSRRLSELYKRVGELQYEDYQQKSTHDIYLKHLCRMKKDLNYMKSKKKVLKNDYQRIMKEQFGKEIDLHEIELAIIKKSFQKTHVNELEEVLLKRLVYEVRVKNTNLKEVFVTELRLWNKKIYEIQDVLADIIKENTKRLELLQVLSHEKKELVNLVNTQSKKKEHVEKLEGIQEKYNQTLEKLEKFVEEQQKQIQDLKLEIKMLKTKGMPPRERRKEELKEIIKEKVEITEPESESPPEERDVIETKESEETVLVIMDYKEETGP
ncbi:unnamed protein product [Callosobruchus maculatus]|nr:unnamed protein product [Callosobruchus maculatus]